MFHNHNANDLNMERLITNIRTKLAYGMSKQDIADAYGAEYDQGTIFLAYSAAKMLNADLEAFQNKRK